MIITTETIHIAMKDWDRLSELLHKNQGDLRAQGKDGKLRWLLMTLIHDGNANQMHANIERKEGGTYRGKRIRFYTYYLMSKYIMGERL